MLGPLTKTSFMISSTTSDKSIKPDLVADVVTVGGNEAVDIVDFEVEEDSNSGDSDVGISFVSSTERRGVETESIIISFKIFERSIKPGDDMVVLELSRGI